MPAYAYGLNVGDTVSVVASAEGPLVISGVVARGDQKTFRIWLGTDSASSAWRTVAESYSQIGCLVDVISARLIAVSCASNDSAAIWTKLEEDTAASSFIWEPGTPD